MGRSGKAILAILAGGKDKSASSAGEEPDDDDMDEGADGDGPEAKYSAHAEKIFPGDKEKQSALIDLIHSCMDEG